jgi:hypothetical protein
MHRHGTALAVAVAMLMSGCASFPTERIPESFGAHSATASEPRGLTPHQLAVVINKNDSQSMAVGAAYVAARGIPSTNVVTLEFATGPILSAATFAVAKAQLDAALVGTPVQALALTWLWPYRVDCM